jgi:regulator of PEP synthase PpsR (kinase-PPPase family)
MNPSKKKVNVFIVSDATGITAERVINAVLVQFKQIQPIFQKFSFVKTKTQIKDILSKAEELDAIVIYSIV